MRCRDMFMQYYSQTITEIWKHQSQHVVHFNSQNQNCHIQILRIVVREHREPALCGVHVWMHVCMCVYVYVFLSIFLLLVS